MAKIIWDNGRGNIVLSLLGSRWQIKSTLWDQPWSMKLIGFLIVNQFSETASVNQKLISIPIYLAVLTSLETILSSQMQSKILGNGLVWDRSNILLPHRKIWLQFLLTVIIADIVSIWAHLLVLILQDWLMLAIKSRHSFRLGSKLLNLKSLRPRTISSLSFNDQVNEISILKFTNYSIQKLSLIHIWRCRRRG